MIAGPSGVDFQASYRLFRVEIFDSGFIAIERLTIRISNPARAAAEIEGVITEPAPMILDIVADYNEQVLDEFLIEEPPGLPVKPSLERLPGIPPCKLVNALKTEVANLKLKLARLCRVIKSNPKAVVSLPNSTATLISVISDPREDLPELEASLTSRVLKELCEMANRDPSRQRFSNDMR
jgi:hypothetical protein